MRRGEGEKQNEKLAKKDRAYIVCCMKAKKTTEKGRIR